MCSLFIKTQYIFYFYQRFLKCKQISFGRCNRSLVKSLLLRWDPQNSLMVPRVSVEIIGTGLAVEHSQGASSKGGCRSSSFSASAELLLFPCDFIPFPDWEDSAGKGQDLPNPGSAARQGLKSASAWRINYICVYLEKLGLTQRNKTTDGSHA